MNTESVRVLHIVAGELTGGAARGALWLHQGLKKQGVSSKMLINSSDTIDDPDIETILKNKPRKLENLINRHVDKFPLRFFKNREKTKFSISFIGYNISKHDLYKWADIIHLHWINGGFINLKHLKGSKKPIVWTMRDMWPFTGGCHYSLTCEKYKIGCGSCPQLGSSINFDLSKFVFLRKKRYLPNTIKLVGVSPWLTSEGKKSELFRDFDIFTISNNINCEDFFPIDKQDARKMLGLKTSKKIILIGAQDINNFYKGFKLFSKSLTYLRMEDFHIAFLGKLSVDVTLDFDYTSFGFLRDTLSLRLLYSAADVFVAPSRQEAFGKTIVESMACGTPVVCFDATGPSHIVDHKINGYKAKPYESEDLAEGIKWVVSNSNYKEICDKSRLKALTSFDTPVVSKQYIDLYNRLTSQDY